MIMDEGDYLEHFGVKGMKWGVRKQRTPSNEVSSTPKKKKLTPEQKASLIKTGIIVASGAIAVGNILWAMRDPSAKTPNLKIKRGNPSIRSKEAERWLRQNKFQNTKVNDIRPSAEAKKKLAEMSPEAKKWISDFTSKQNDIIDASNGDLQEMYRKGQVPLPAREYLDRWL